MVNYNTIEKCIDSKLPSLIKARKEIGDKKLMVLMIKTIENAISFFNHEIPERVLTSIAGMIVKEYYYLNLADISLCLENAKLGKYDKPYGNLQGVVVMDWIAQYVGERDAFAEEQSYQKHMALTSCEKERQYDGLINRLQEADKKINKFKPTESHQEFFEKGKGREVTDWLNQKVKKETEKTQVKTKKL